jgi:hypothetical protein
MILHVFASHQTLNYRVIDRGLMKCVGALVCCFSALYSQMTYIVLLLRKPEDVTFFICLALNLILNFPSILFMTV